jgi:hypothetical protein
MQNYGINICGKMKILKKKYSHPKSEKSIGKNLKKNMK